MPFTLAKHQPIRYAEAQAILRRVRIRYRCPCGAISEPKVPFSPAALLQVIRDHVLPCREVWLENASTGDALGTLRYSRHHRTVILAVGDWEYVEVDSRPYHWAALLMAAEVPIAVRAPKRVVRALELREAEVAGESYYADCHD